MDEKAPTYEDAIRCPKCDTPNKVYKQTRGGNDLTTHWVKCNNSLCAWYEETYFFQTRADGTIPPPRKTRS